MTERPDNVRPLPMAGGFDTRMRISMEQARVERIRAVALNLLRRNLTAYLEAWEVDPEFRDDAVVVVLEAVEMAVQDYGKA